jgi:hypothetical protein
MTLMSNLVMRSMRDKELGIADKTEKTNTVLTQHMPVTNGRHSLGS